jgi:hypothetical protein
MTMIARSRPGFVLALFLAAASSARAADDRAVVSRATRLLEEISSSSDSGIPARVLREAEGVTIMPGVVETELVVGRKRGRGVFLPRKESGEWGDPEPAEVSGVSVGRDVRDVRDVAMIYRTKKAADNRGRQSLSLAVDLRAYWLPKDRRKFSGPGPDSKLSKEVLFMIDTTVSSSAPRSRASADGSTLPRRRDPTRRRARRPQPTRRPPEPSPIAPLSLLRWPASRRCSPR